MTRRGLLTGFAVLHVVYALSIVHVIVSGGTEGDLPLYRLWAQQAIHGYWPVFDFPWVYPAGALAPIMLSIAAGPYLFQALWLILMAAGNFAAIAALTGGFRRIADYPAAWYWLLIQVLLAPVSMLRLEGAAAPLAIAGLVLLARRPAVAGALIAAATWIKVWPIAIAAAAVTVLRTRWRVVAGGLALTAGVVAAVAVGGGIRNLFSFATIQSDRALQLEAPIATPWVWGAVLRVPGAAIRQNYELATREVSGPGVYAAGEFVTLLMPVVFLGIVALLWMARSRAARERRLTPALEQRLVLRGSFALAATLIVFNKVGSPQYMLWIAPIVAVGVMVDPRGWRRIAIAVAVASVLTSLVFPILYMPLVDAQPVPAFVLLLRNLIVVALFVESVVWLWRAAAARVPVPVGVGAPATAVVPASD